MNDGRQTGTGGWLAAARFVVLAVFASFAPARDASFVNWDDEANIVDNDEFRGLEGEHLEWMFTRAFGGPYMPLTWLSLAADHALWGLGEGLEAPEAPAYHRTNVLLHALCAVAFLCLARRVLRSVFPDADERGLLLACTLASLWFAVHPLRVESVAWVTERRDVLSGLLFVLAVAAWLRATPRGSAPRLAGGAAALTVAGALAAPLLFFASVDLSGDALAWRGPGALGFAAAVSALFASVFFAGHAAHVEGQPRRSLRLVLAVALLIAAFLSKALGVTLPLVLLVLDAWPLARLRRGSAVALVVEKLPLFALSAVFGALAVWGQAQFSHTLSNWEDHTLSERLVQALYGLFFYPSRTLVPVDLIPLVQLPQDVRLADPRFLTAAIAVVVCGALLVWRRRAWPGALVAMLAFALLVAPVLGLTQAGSQLVADRYSYLPGMPLALLGAGGWLAWRRRARSSTPLVAAVLVCLALGAATWRQTSHWRDSRALWTHMIAVAPEAGLPHMLLGMLTYREAQDAPPGQTDARLEEARAHFARGVELEEVPIPFYMNAYGALLIDLRRPQEARTVLEAFVMNRPEDAVGRMNLGAALTMTGQPRRAVEQLEQAVLLDPDYPKAWMHLGFAYEAVGREAEALRAFERVLESWPRYGPAKQRVRALRGTGGDSDPGVPR